MVSSARLVLVLVLLAGMLAPGSAFSVLSMDVSPAEGVQPKDPIQVSGTLQLASPGTQGFPANHTLNFSTDLLKAAWNFTIVVDGVSRQNLELRGGEAVLYGFSLSYPNDTPVQVEIGLEGSVPPNASPSLTAIQVQEMDEQGLPLPGSAYSRAIRVIRPPAPPPTTAPEPTTLPLPSPSPTATTEPPPASPPTTPPPEPTPLPQPTTPVPTETATPVPPGGGAFPVLPLAILVLVGIALLAGGSLVQRWKGAGGAGGPSPTLPAPPPILNRSWDSWWQHLIPEGSDIQAGTLDAVFRISLELALEGREGRKVGTAFVVGDADAVLAHSRQLILNPFEGHPPEDRRITRPEMREAIKELAQLDGAFVVQGDGTIEAAARYITVDTSLVRLPSGFGTRHSSIAAITRMTRSIGIVVSQSGGKISILRDGKLLRTVSPFSQNPPQPHS